MRDVAASQCEFAFLVYQVLVVERVVTLAQAAKALGLTYGAMHSRVNQRTRFRPAEIKRLVETVPDPRLVRFFTDDSSHIVVHRPVAEADTSTTVGKAVAHTMKEAIDIWSVANDILAHGGRLSHQERADLIEEVKQAEIAIATLRLTVETI